MPMTPEMEARCKKIKELETKGYNLKTSLFGFNHLLTNSEGERVYTFNNRNKDLPGWSPIGFWLGPYVAVQSRQWNYFWVWGISSFLFEAIILGIGLSSLNFLTGIFGIIFAYIYAHNFPYQRWFFSKSNKKEIGVFASIVWAGLLSFAVSIPTIVLPTKTIRDLPIANNSLISQSKSSQDSSYYYNLGLEQGSSEDYVEAIKNFTKAIEINPKSVNAYNARGIAKASQGDFSGAIEDYDKAIEIDPKFWYAYYNRSRAKGSGLKDYYGAISDCNKAIEINPSDADTYYNRGLYKGKGLKDYAGAIADNTKAIEIDPNYINAYLHLGVFKDMSGDHYGAISTLNKGIAIDNKDSSLYRSRGIAKENIGDRQGACYDYKKAADLGDKVTPKWVKEQCS